MPNKFFFTDKDGTRVICTLYSLAEYEEDGGLYDDSGNGGESWLSDDQYEAIFDGLDYIPSEDRYRIGSEVYNNWRDVARLDILDDEWYVDEDDVHNVLTYAKLEAGRSEGFVAAMTLVTEDGDDYDLILNLGLNPKNVWWDSYTGYYLIREFPGIAPISARLIK